MLSLSLLIRIPTLFSVLCGPEKILTPRGNETQDEVL